ncbi:MAG: hypothetical protein V4735_06410 [Pseudomonadota bacterium]
MIKKIVAILALITLAACEQAPGSYQPEPFSFEHATPMRVNVAQIKVIEAYKSALRRPNVEQDFPVPPAVAVNKWVAQRLIASGSTGVMEITIDDASVKEVPLSKTKGVTGLFTDDQDARYDARIHVTMRVYDGVNAISAASGDIEVTRARSINEKATVDERQRIFHKMTRDMMDSFDQQAQARLRSYFSKFLN